MPFPNEHAARIKDPKQFEKFTRKQVKEGISIILGIKEGKSTAQSYRFKSDTYTPEEAKKWLKDNGIVFISFEKAVKKTQAFKKIILKSRRIVAFSHEILDKIPNNILRKIKEKDEHPYFQMYSICHEGEAAPNIIGEGAKKIKWTRAAIESFKNIITKGVKLFRGHNKDNEHENRESVGQIIHSFQKEINGKLHHIAITYHPPKVRDKIKDCDICSQESEWDFIEKSGNWIADKIKKLTGIALENSNNEKPAFKGTKRLGMVQAFDYIETKENNNDRRARVTFQEIRDAVKSMNIFPWQLYSLDDLKKDREFGRHFDELEKYQEEQKKDKEELENIKIENQELKRKSLLSTAKIRLGDMAKTMTLTELQRKYINDSFTNDAEDITDEGLQKFIEKKIDEFKRVAGYLEPENIKPNKPNHEVEDENKDFTLPENNDLILEQE